MREAQNLSTDFQQDDTSGLTWRIRLAPASKGQSDPVPGLVVVYSQVRIPHGRFGLERLFSATRHPCLFVNAPDETWYLGCEDALDGAIDQAVKQTGAGQIFHYGASKGAYGALVTGLRRNDGPVYAFGPEFELGAPGTQSALYVPNGSAGPNLIDALARAPDGPDITLVFGLFDPVDAAGAAALNTHSPPERVHVLPLRSTHASHDHLYSLNIIRKLITRFDRDLTQLCVERDLIADHAAADIARFAKAGAHFSAGMPPLAFAEEVEPDRNDTYCTINPGFAHLTARMHTAIGDLREAEHILSALQDRLDADPVLSGLPKRWRKEIWRDRLEIAKTLRNTAHLAWLTREIGTRFPEDPTLRGGAG